MIKNNLRRTVTKRNKNKFSFVADTKIIIGYNFVAPLKISQFSQENTCVGASNSGVFL